MPLVEDKPQRYILALQYWLEFDGPARCGCGESPARLIGAPIPNRSPGHTFIAVIIISVISEVAGMIGTGIGMCVE